MARRKLKIKLPNLKKAKEIVKSVKDSVKKAGGNAREKAARMIIKGREAAALALFGPFAPIAQKYVQRRGIAPAKTSRGLVKQVFAISRAKHFGLADDAIPDAFDVRMDDNSIQSFGLVDEAGANLDGAAADAEGGEVSPIMIQGVIQFLISIFQAIKAKQAAGQPLSEDEKKVADLASKIDEAVSDSKEIAEGVDAESENEAGNLLSGFDWKKALAVILLLVLVFFLIRR